MPKKSSKLSTIFILVICFLLCFSFAELFSSLITVGGFNYYNAEVKQSSFCLYAICLYKTETKASAQSMSEVILKQNGAGFIDKTDTNYCVYASCYESENDAQKVQKNLEEQNKTCEIVKIEFDEICFKNDLSSQEKTALLNAACSYKNYYKKLYDLSVSIDTNLYTEIQAKTMLDEIIRDYNKTKTNFENLFNSKLTTQILSLKLSLNNISEILNELSNFSSNEISFSAKVKYAYFDVLFEYKNLSKEMN